MKVLIIHVGNEVEKGYAQPEEDFLKRRSLLDGEYKYFMKHDIINADTQMESLVEAGVQVEYGHFSNRKSINSLWQAGKKIRQICYEEKINLVHVLWGTTTSFVTVLAAPLPVIISFCGSDLFGNVDHRGKITLSGRLSRMLSQISGLMAKRIITKSELMKATLWSINQKKCVAIPNGVELRSFYPIPNLEAKSRLGWDADIKTIIFFDSGGSVVKDKNLADRVADLVISELDNVEYRVLHGISHHELVHYYNAADVLLLTSYHEGSNNSIKEAMACNLPIVSVNVGDSKERLGSLKNSYITTSRNPTELSEKVKSVIVSGKRCNGREYISELSVDRIAEKVIEQYNAVFKK